VVAPVGGQRPPARPRQPSWLCGSWVVTQPVFRLVPRAPYAPTHALALRAPVVVPGGEVGARLCPATAAGAGVTIYSNTCWWGAVRVQSTTASSYSTYASSSLKACKNTKTPVCVSPMQCSGRNNGCHQMINNLLCAVGCPECNRVFSACMRCSSVDQKAGRHRWRHRSHQQQECVVCGCCMVHGVSSVRCTTCHAMHTQQRLFSRQAGSQPAVAAFVAKLRLALCAVARNKSSHTHTQQPVRSCCRWWRRWRCC
jgi:hypothetical protein